MSESVYDVLTGCLISECQCFQPKLPEAHNKISFDGLIALKGIIASEVDEATQTPQQIIPKQSIADAIGSTTQQPSVTVQKSEA